MHRFGIQPEWSDLKARAKYKGMLGWIRRKRDNLIHKLIGTVED